jgi:LuxR family transcriptional regulator, maltose regulon positive regulatory protein
MENLCLLWLGSPSITSKGHPIHLEMRKTLALLAYLSLSPQPASREILAAMFWPEFDQQHAMSNLRRNLSSLCKCLPDGLVEADRDRIVLQRPEWLKVDVHEFRERLLHASPFATPNVGECQEYITALEQAAEIYRGDFFEGFNLKDCPEFDEWQFFQRENLRQELAAALEKLIDYYSSLSHWEKASSTARRWMLLDPLHEPAQLALIHSMAASGHLSAAQRQYEIYTKLLKEALDLEPSPEVQEMLQNNFQKAEPAKDKRDALAASFAPQRKDYREQIIGPILKTKLYIPGVREHHVSRDRLLERLDGVEDYKLILISAPAGFGKTSMLAEWIANSSLSVSWLSLDRGDNHPGRFLAYLIHSLQSIDERIGIEAWNMLGMPDPPPMPTILTSLINDCSATVEPFALILDDYQSIHSQNIHEVTGFLIEHSPSQVHLIISSRVDPPIPFARLRSSGKLLEIRLSDLRFSSEEAIRFLNRKMGLNLTESEVKLLNDRTEGWAAGLQMAALSIVGQENPGDYIQKLSGSHRFIMDYLMEEVFERQPEEIKTFLLKTSILERLFSPLCAYVVGELSPGQKPHTPAQHILELLEHSNLFVERLDEERCWYRYHHLFAELLYNRLQQYFPEKIAALHTRAADWYESEGMGPQIIHHALAARDYERVASFVEKVASSLWEHGNYPLAFSWFKTLPEEVILRRPWLCLYQAWALALDGKIDPAEKMLGIVEQGNKSNPDPVDQKNLSGYIDFVRAIIADSQGELEVMIKYDLDALGKLDEKNQMMRRGITFQLARAYHLIGDQDTAQKIWGEIIQTDRRTGTGFASVMSMCMLAWLKVAVGKLKEAEAICKEAEDWIEKANEPRTSRTAGFVWSAYAVIYLEKNEIDLVEKYVREGLQCFERMSHLYVMTIAYIVLAGALRRKQDFAGARLSLEKAEAIIQGRKIFADALSWLKAEKLHLWLAVDDLPSAQQYLSENNITSSDRVEFKTEVQYIALARVLTAQGTPDDAIQLLQRMAEAAEKGKRPGRLIKILTVLALAWQKMGRMEEAVRTLHEALSLASPEGFAGAFSDGGEPMIELLKYYSQSWVDAFHHTINHNFIQEVLGRKSVVQ